MIPNHHDPIRHNKVPKVLSEATRRHTFAILLGLFLLNK